MKKYIFPFLLTFTSVYGQSVTDPYPPLIQDKLVQAAKECLEFSREFAVRKKSVLQHFFKDHSYTYIVLDKSRLSCSGCQTCFHPSGGKYVSIFWVKKEGDAEKIEPVFENELILSYRIDPTQDKSRPFPIMLKVKEQMDTKTVSFIWDEAAGKYKRQ